MAFLFNSMQGLNLFNVSDIYVANINENYALRSGAMNILASKLQYSGLLLGSGPRSVVAPMLALLAWRVLLHRAFLYYGVVKSANGYRFNLFFQQ